MFGFVSVNWKELSKAQQDRYGGIYCGICRAIGKQSSHTARLVLHYDMAFLALLLMSLYEPEEQRGPLHCAVHPFRRRDWVDSEYIQYCADMNVALAYYKAMDDYTDEGKISAKLAAKALQKELPRIESQYGRQCRAMEEAFGKLRQLEQENCTNPDLPANVFGELMAALLVYKEDLWAQTLEQMGMALGRFIYLADAAVDYREDMENNRYNPFAAMDGEKNWQRWEDFLILIMGRCTHYYEKLPLVQDKDLLDNILYSGVWVNLQGKKAREKA